MNHFRFPSRCLWLAALFWALRAGAATPEADEYMLWQLWKQHAAAPSNHAALVRGYASMRRQIADPPLRAVADSLAAWHFLKTGQTNHARTVLEPVAAAEGGELAEAASYLAKTWLSRIDLERVKQGLSRYYARHARFPESLDALAAWPAERRPPLTDRWGRPWFYRLVGFSRLHGLRDQRYDLRCSVLGARSDLRTALGSAYGPGAKLRPLSVAAAGAGNATVQFAPADGSRSRILLSAGSSAEGLTLVYVGKRVLIATDREYWCVWSRPR